MKKWKSESGETLVETLTSVLIAVLVFAFFATAAVSAAKINGQVKNTDLSFHYEQSPEKQITVTLRQGTAQSKGSVELYESNGYQYYRAANGGTR